VKYGDLTSALVRARQQILKPPPRLSLSEWADTYRHLSPESSAEPGKWKTARAEYLRGIMDTISDPEYEEVWVMSASQIGKSELILMVLGYYIHQDPSPILLVQPTVETSKAFSKDRVATMIRDTPALRGLVSDSKSRDSANTIQSKQFPGGNLNIIGANAPSGLASRPIRVLCMDEVDRYPASAGTEGDPVSLARQRTANFYNRKIVGVSTPTVAGFSRVESAYAQSDQRHYYIPCFNCHQEWSPRWAHVKWQRGDSEHQTHTAVLECPACKHEHGEGERLRAVARGHWRATFPDRRVAGFHLSAIISPWVKLRELADEFLRTRSSKELLQTFTNLKLGEVWEDRGESLEHIDFLDRKEDYTLKQVPRDVVYLTAGVDTQDDRLEIQVLGWCKSEDIYVVDYEIVHGNPASLSIWKQLSEILQRTYEREDRALLPIVAASLDSGGHHTQRVYSFCNAHSQRRWWAVKGSSVRSTPIFPKRASRSKKHADVKLYSIGVHAAKEFIYSSLRIEPGQPGQIHFPEDLEADYFEQLTAEKVVTRYSYGIPHKIFQLPKGKRNEALDTFVYAVAARAGIKVDVERTERSNIKRIPASATASEESAGVNREARTHKRPRKPGYVSRLKA